MSYLDNLFRGTDGYFIIQQEGTTINPKVTKLNVINGTVIWNPIKERHDLIVSSGGTNTPFNGTSGHCTLVNGSATVTLTLPSTATIVFSRNTEVGDIGDLYLASQSTAGFTIASSSNHDQSVVNWAAVGPGVVDPGGGGDVPIGDPDSVYWSNGGVNIWSTTPVVQSIDAQEHYVVSTDGYEDNKIKNINGAVAAQYHNGGYGTYIVAPKPYNETATHAPHHDKKWGSFTLIGPDEFEQLNFSTAIGGDAMPPNSNLVGKILLGWTNTNSYIGSSIEILINIVTNSSGNIYRITSNIMGASEYAGPSHPWTIDALTAADITGSYVLPTGSIIPNFCFLTSTGTTWALQIGTKNEVSADDIQKYYWEAQWGWGSASS